MFFRIATLGCKVNQYESELIRTTLRANGWSDDSGGEGVDWVIVNTCSVTAESDAKSRKMIGALAKAYPNAKIAVVGCFAAANPQVAASLPQVREVVGDKRALGELFARLGATVLPDGIDGAWNRHRAYVKVQDGCRVGCAYCIIPTVRPYLESRPIDSVRREIERLAQKGYREIVLTGIHLGHYGLDLLFSGEEKQTPQTLDDSLARRASLPPEQSPSLTRLLESILAEKFPVRYRLGSLEAVEVPDDLIGLVSSHTNLCPHFHLSMQSGSDAVLKRMRRRWPAGKFLEQCERIVRHLPGVALTTDVIVGFPGETEADFAASCEWVERIGFAKTHTFRFSPRAGTVAATLPDPVAESVKKERAARLDGVAMVARRRYVESKIGETLEVLVEAIFVRGEKFLATGTSEHYLTVEFEIPASNKTLLGTLQLVRAETVRGDQIFGRLADVRP